MKKYPQVAAGKFKAECLELLDRVANEGNTYVVTKRGKPVAKVCPVDKPKPKSLIGSVIYMGDIMAPVDMEWSPDDEAHLYEGLPTVLPTPAPNPSTKKARKKSR